MIEVTRGLVVLTMLSSVDSTKSWNIDANWWADCKSVSFTLAWKYKVEKLDFFQQFQLKTLRQFSVLPLIHNLSKDSKSTWFIWVFTVLGIYDFRLILTQTESLLTDWCLGNSVWCRMSNYTPKGSVVCGPSIGTRTSKDKGWEVQSKLTYPVCYPAYFGLTFTSQRRSLTHRFCEVSYILTYFPTTV